MRPVPQLKVRLLGSLGLELDGRALVAPVGRCGSLLAWLAINPGMQPRAQVAARLWPDVLDTCARRSLRTALLDLRRELGPAAEQYLIATRDDIGLGPPEEIWVDAREFAVAVGEGRLEDALALGDGELLPELDHEWIYLARDAHRETLEQITERLADDAERAGDLMTAIWHTRRLAAMDPLGETQARALIRRLAAADDRAAALAADDRHRERLRICLGLTPSPATRELAHEIRRSAGQSHQLRLRGHMRRLAVETV